MTKRRTSPRKQQPPPRDIDEFLDALASQHDAWFEEWAAMDLCLSSLESTSTPPLILPI